MAQKLKDFAIEVADEIQKITGEEITNSQQEEINNSCMDYWIDGCSIEYTALQLLISCKKNGLKTTTTNQQAINLINRAFDADGYLVTPKSNKNQTEARQLLESGIDFYGEFVNGRDTHNCLLIIANPNKNI